MIYRKYGFDTGDKSVTLELAEADGVIWLEITKPNKVVCTLRITHKLWEEICSVMPLAIPSRDSLASRLEFMDSLETED